MSPGRDMRTLGILLSAMAVLAGACGGGGSVADSFRETTTTTAVDPAVVDPGSITVVSQNLLHGAFCPEETNACRAADRVALFLGQIDGACPDVVALQEIDANLLALLEARVPGVCGGRYDLVWHGMEGIDRELVLTRLPVLEHELHPLAGGLRAAFRVRLAASLGVVELVVTHLASRDNPACDAERCPPPCDPAGDTRTCQAVQIRDLFDTHRAENSLGLLVGDLNDVGGSPTLRTFLDAGWVDAHLVAGNPECDPTSGLNCTSGRESEDLSDLLDPAARQTERIDFTLVLVPDACVPEWDSAGDLDGDGIPTGPFRPEPASDAGTGDPPALAFASDHTAVALDVSCARRSSP